MSDTIKGAIIGAIITTVGSILVFFLGNFSTQATIEKKTVETLSEYFDSVDKDMSFKQALQTVYEDARYKDDEISKLNQQNDELKGEISDTPQFEFKNPSLVSDGLKIQDAVNKSIIVVDNNNYYSEGILNLILGNKLLYDSSQNVVFYNANGENVTAETKIDLFDTDVLYDGKCYNKYLPVDGSTFSMGSSTYNKGFVIYDDLSILGAGDGYALFDLQGKYSKITFDIGRTNKSQKVDVTLRVYLDGEYYEEYSLSAESPPVQLEIGLNYANNMKLEIVGKQSTEYGFTNVFLHY